MQVKPYSFALTVVALVVLGHLAGIEGRSGRQKRTIGGNSFSRGQYPFLVLLRATIVTERLLGVAIRHYHLYCGGVLINDRWLLTAAHCFSDVPRPSNWEARMGTVRLRAGLRQRLLDLVGRVTRLHELRQWEVDVDRVVVHPGYNRTGFLSDDIALVRLSSRIPRRRVPYLISPLPLPDQSDETFPSLQDDCITMGWGCTAPGQGPSRQARHISMPLRPATTCRHHYGDITMEHRICAGHTNSGIGVCQGDSGSPLVCRSGSGYKLAGIVSFTSRQRPENFPAVFVSVKDYLPWIEQVISRN